MSDFSAQTPFTQVYNALWAALESRTTFTNLVKLNNRIKWTTYDDPEKTTAQDSDMPMCVVMPTSTGIRLAESYLNHELDQTYEVFVSTQDVRLAGQINPVAWALLKAVAFAHDALGSLDFVTSVRLGDLVMALGDEEAGKGTKGWSLSIEIVVTMHINKDCFIDPQITTYTPGTRTVAGTGFLASQGNGKLRQRVGTTWSDIVIYSWTDTVIVINAPLLPEVVAIRVKNNGNNISSEVLLA